MEDDFGFPVEFVEHGRATVSKVAADTAIEGLGDKPRGQRRRHPGHDAAPDEAGEHFAALSQAAEDAHQVMVERGLPYRFCIYREGKEIFIDIVKLDADGKMSDIKKKNITHDEFNDWVEKIHKGEGFTTDTLA